MRRSPQAQKSQIAGHISLVGNAMLVAGEVVQFKGYGKLSGKYSVKHGRGTNAAQLGLHGWSWKSK